MTHSATACPKCTKIGACLCDCHTSDFKGWRDSFRVNNCCTCHQSERVAIDGCNDCELVEIETNDVGDNPRMYLSCKNTSCKCHTQKTVGECLRCQAGVCSAHQPTEEGWEAEFERIWANFFGRPPAESAFNTNAARLTLRGFAAQLVADSYKRGREEGAEDRNVTRLVDATSDDYEAGYKAGEIYGGANYRAHHYEYALEKGRVEGAAARDAELRTICCESCVSKLNLLSGETR